MTPTFPRSGVSGHPGAVHNFNVMSMSFFPENLKLMSSVSADERDAPAISVRNAAAAVALYAIASRDRCRLTGEWLRNTYADFMDNSSYP
jgi:hypothetical protein